MTRVFTLKNLVKYIIFIGIIYGLMIIIQSQEISKINLILIVSIIYISFILLDCLNNNSESFSDGGSAITSYTVTSAPTLLTPVAGNGFVDLSWNAPSSTGGIDISSYVIQRSIDSSNWTTDSSTNATTRFKRVTNLSNGTPYYFRVFVTNLAGNGTASTASNAVTVTPFTVPNAPTNLTGTAGNAQANLSWDAPASNGGRDISSYNVISSPAGGTTTINFATRTATVTNLINGTVYTFTVTATNVAGTLAASNSIEVTPFTVPNAQTNLTGTADNTPEPFPITNLTAIAGNGQATVTWTVPTNNDGPNRYNYKIKNNINSDMLNVDASTLITYSSQEIIWTSSKTVNGLTETITTTVPRLINGTTYTFTLHGQKMDGLMGSIYTSNSVTPSDTIVSRPLPPSPTNVTAIGGDGEVSVTWTIPINNGVNISSYIIKNNLKTNILKVDASSFLTTIVDAYSFLPLSSTPITTLPATTTSENGLIKTITAIVPGLINGTPYSFYVQSINTEGPSPVTSLLTKGSSVGHSVGPMESIHQTNVTAIAGNGQASVTWTIPINNTPNRIDDYLITNNVNTRISTIVNATSFFTRTYAPPDINIPIPISTAITTTINGLTTITATVPGLINGTPYTFTVHPRNTGEHLPVKSLSTSNSVTPTNNIMLYVTILGGFIVGLFLLYLVIRLFSSNNPDKEEVQEEVEEKEEN